MPPPTLKVCVLGSSGVGKTKMVKQFVNNYYDDDYEPTVRKEGETHFSSVVLNGRLYLLRIIDMPMIKQLPLDSHTEWSEYHHCLLRTAHAYIFVFDLNLPASFYYVKVIRDQLFESRAMQNVPVWIVGNRADQCLNVLASVRRHDHHHHHQGHRSHARPPVHASQASSSSCDDIVPAFKDLANLVRKQWKCNYIECSVKFNWHVAHVFREIVKSLDASHRQLVANEPQPQQQQQQAQQASSSLATPAHANKPEPSVRVMITNASSDKCLNELSGQQVNPSSRPSSSSRPLPLGLDQINGASHSQTSQPARITNRGNICHVA